MFIVYSHPFTLFEMFIIYNLMSYTPNPKSYPIAHSAWSTLRGMRKSNGKAVSVEDDGLVDKLIQSVFPNHFGIEVDEVAKQKILDVAKVYSKSKTGTEKEWVEDSRTKMQLASPEIRGAAEAFLSKSYSELKKYNIK